MRVAIIMSAVLFVLAMGMLAASCTVQKYDAENKQPLPRYAVMVIYNSTSNNPYYIFRTNEVTYVSPGVLRFRADTGQEITTSTFTVYDNQPDADKAK